MTAPSQRRRCTAEPGALGQKLAEAFARPGQVPAAGQERVALIPASNAAALWNRACGRGTTSGETIFFRTQTQVFLRFSSCAAAPFGLRIDLATQFLSRGPRNAIFPSSTCRAGLLIAYPWVNL